MFMYKTNWFNSLKKPLLAPPDWVFTPVWVILYITMFVALFFYINKISAHTHRAGLILFFIQLFLNLAWSPVFFYFHNIKLALVICIFLTISVIATSILFYKSSKVAGLLLLPYALWCSYATYLTFRYWVLN